MLTLKNLRQFDIAYEGICGLCDMGVVKTNEVLLSSEEIKKNMIELKSKLAGHSSHLSKELYKTLKDVSYRDLTWKDPLASQVISDNSNIVQKLAEDEYNNFMVAFAPEFEVSQNEGTYVMNIIAPSIQAVLKDLPFAKSSYISIAEKQSTASADRKGKFGKRPDLMFILKHKEFVYELVY
ncbi:10536_t:CDS:2, partial [Entrophospora sp. SA101]